MREAGALCDLMVQKGFDSFKVDTNSGKWVSGLTIRIGPELDAFFVMLSAERKDQPHNRVEIKKEFHSIGVLKVWLGTIHDAILHALLGSPTRHPGWGNNLVPVMEMMEAYQRHLDALSVQLLEERGRREEMHAQTYSGT